MNQINHEVHEGKYQDLRVLCVLRGGNNIFSYDVDKISSIALDGNPLISGIRYNGANQLTGWTWSDGSAYTKTYDTNGRLKTFSLGDQTRTLKYDKLGNITGWFDTNGESKAFSYDLLSRLTGYSKTQGNQQIEESQHFSYDANGNRLKLIENKDSNEEIQTLYSILENANRLTKVADTDYQYDANGNIINDGEHSYTYDARNRLVSIDNGTSASYLYNASNMRVKKTTVNETTNYGWDNDRIFAEYDASGNPIQETVYFSSTPIALLKDGKTYRIFADQIDTPRVITDNTNNTLWIWDSKPFGESQPDEDVDGDNTKLSYNLRFPGQYYDQETGKHYNFNRDYNPVTGRYVQSDPIGLDGGTGMYVYSLVNSLKNIDPLGTFTIYLGGGGDNYLYHAVVKNFAREIEPNTSAYFEHYISNSTIKNYIDNVRIQCPGEQIVMVGHSWGGDSAIEFAQAYSGAVNILITVDPVGWFPPASKPAGTNFWLNVDAIVDNWTQSDYIAWAGYEWGSDMKGVADQYFEMRNDFIHHGYFGMMMGYDDFYSPAGGFIEKYSRYRSCSNKRGLGSGSGGY